MMGPCTSCTQDLEDLVTKTSRLDVSARDQSTHRSTTEIPRPDITAPHEPSHCPFPLLMLPNEIIYAITETLDIKTLSSLQQTCHALFTLVAPLVGKCFAKDCEEVFIWALKKNRGPIVARAVEAGAKFDDPLTEYYGMTPLVKAAEQGWDCALQVLIEAGANINTEWVKNTPLSFAVKARLEPTVRILLEAGAKMELAWAGKPSLRVAVWRRELSMIRTLVEYSTKAEPPHRLVSEVLCQAVRQDSEEIVKILLEHGADTNTMSDFGYPWTIFHHAIYCGNIAIVELFLSHGAAKKDRDLPVWQNTCLSHAARFSGVEVVALLLQHGADTSARGTHGYTPLHITIIYRGRDEVRKLLLDTAIDIDHESYEHYTALHLAVCRGNIPAIKMFLASGAQIGHVRRHVWNPVRSRAPSSRQFASSEEVRKVLLEAGAITEDGS